VALESVCYLTLGLIVRLFIVVQANHVSHGFFQAIDTNRGEGRRRITGGVNTIALISPELQAAIEAA